MALTYPSLEDCLPDGQFTVEFFSESRHLQ